MRKKAVNAYVTSLMRTWVKAFGLENVAPCITVAKKIRAGLESHFNDVLWKGHSALSKRERLQQWRESPKVNCLLDTLKSTSDPHSFNENEKLLIILGRKLLQELDTLVKKLTFLMKFSKKKSYNRCNLKMRYICLR